MPVPDVTDVDLLDEYARRARAAFQDDVASELTKLSDGHGYRFRLGDPDATLPTDVTRTLVAAGFAIHDCAAHDRAGGVCLTPASASQRGVIVTWTTHDALAVDPRRYSEHRDVQDIMNTALGDVLVATGWHVDRFGQAGARIVTGRVHTSGRTS